MNWCINIGKVLFANGVNLLSGFGITLLLSLSLPVVSYGDYALLLSVLALLHIVPCALNPGSLLYLSEAIDKRQQTLLTLLLFRILLSSLLVILFVLLAPTLASYLHDGRVPSSLYLFLAFQALFASVERQLLQWYQVEERFSAYAKLTLTARLLKIGATSLLFITGSLSLHSAIFVLLLTQCIAVVPGCYELMKLGIHRELYDRELVKKMTTYSLSMLLGQVMVYVGMRSSIILISRYVSATDTGNYGFALTLLESLFLLSQSVIAVVTPRLLDCSKPLNHRLVMFLFAGLALFYASVAFVAPLCAEYVMSLFMKSKFSESIALFKTLVLGGWFFMVSTGPMVLLHRKKRAGSLVLVEAVGAISLLCGNLLMVPQMGIDGALWAFVIARVASFVTLLLLLAPIKWRIFLRRNIDKNIKGITIEKQLIETSQYA